MNECQKCIEPNKFCLKIQEVMLESQSCAPGGTQYSVGNTTKCEYKQPCVDLTEEECRKQGGRWCAPSSSTARGTSAPRR